MTTFSQKIEDTFITNVVHFVFNYFASGHDVGKWVRNNPPIPYSIKKSHKYTKRKTKHWNWAVKVHTRKNRKSEDTLKSERKWHDNFNCRFMFGIRCRRSGFQLQWLSPGKHSQPHDDITLLWCCRLCVIAPPEKPSPGSEWCLRMHIVNGK